MEDLHYNAGFGTKYLRINGTYYHTTTQEPWHIITPQQAGSLQKWRKIGTVQRRAFIRVLGAFTE